MPLWTPANSTPLPDLWINPTDAATITLSGSNIAQINDKSPTAGHFSQTTSGNQPLRNATGINNLPVMQFDGSVDILVGNAAAEAVSQNVAGLSIFSVINSTGGSSVRRAVLYFSTNSTSSARAGLFVLPSPNRIEAGGRRLDGNGFQAVTATCSFPCLGAAIFDYAGAEAYAGVNGVYTARGGFQTSGSTSNTAAVLTSIGNGGGNIYGGLIGELIVFKSVLAQPARELIEGYLAWEWGLQASLQATHPYRNGAPTIPEKESRRRRELPAGFGL
jgi:hypothetical protein